MRPDANIRPPAQHHSFTSCEAAEDIAGRAGSIRRRVYDAIVAAGRSGLTDQQIQVRLGIDPSTERPRRIELCALGLVEDSGITRETTSGHRAVVWVAVRRGQQELFR